jgi:hypothetical protein
MTVTADGPFRVLIVGMLECDLAYIEKPFRPTALLGKVREVLQTPG